MDGSGKDAAADDVLYCRRQAMHMALQLPADPALAEATLGLAREIYDCYLRRDNGAATKSKPEIRLVAIGEPG